MMQHESAGRHSRWYDNYSHIHALVGMSAYLPQHLKLTLAETFYSIVSQYHQVLQRDGAISLGANVVMRLHSSKRKKRWYDKIGPFHRAFNLLSAFPEPACRQLDEKCAAIVKHYQPSALIPKTKKPLMPVFINEPEHRVEVRNKHYYITHER